MSDGMKFGGWRLCDNCGLPTNIAEIFSGVCEACREGKPREPGLDEAKQWKDACLRELGYAHVYMHYLNPRFLNSECSQDQKKRVEQLCMEMAVHWHHWDAKMWEAFHDQITDEIENMC